MPSSGTRHKIHVSAKMRGNSNRVDPHFSDDLFAQFGDDPELREWINSNKKSLDSPNTDGTIPFGEDHLNEHERRKFLAADTAVHNGGNRPKRVEDCCQ